MSLPASLSSRPGPAGSLAGSVPRSGPRSPMETTMRQARSPIVLALLPMLVLSFASERPVQAENYPARPVKLVLPYPAGGPGDVMARILAQKLSEQTGG